MHEMSSEQVKQREEKYPDDIDEVPVKTRDLDRVVVIRAESTLPGLVQQPQHDAQTDHHVKSVQARHHEVYPEERTDVFAEFFSVELVPRIVAGPLESRQDAFILRLFGESTIGPFKVSAWVIVR